MGLRIDCFMRCHESSVMLANAIKLHHKLRCKMDFGPFRDPGLEHCIDVTTTELSIEWQALSHTKFCILYLWWNGLGLWTRPLELCLCRSLTPLENFHSTVSSHKIQEFLLLYSSLYILTSLFYAVPDSDSQDPTNISCGTSIEQP